MYSPRPVFAVIMIAVVTELFVSTITTAFTVVPSSSFSVSAPILPLRSTSSVAKKKTRRRTLLFAEPQALPNLETMKARDLKKELESYGISTQSMLEKSDFVDALKKAREQGMKPIVDKEAAEKEKQEKKEEEEVKAEVGTQTGNSGDGKEVDTKTKQSEKKVEDVSTSRAAQYQKAFDDANRMRVKELRDELNSRGISTTTMLEKSEFIKAYAEAIADNIPKGASASTSSSSSSSSKKSSTSSSESKSTRKEAPPKKPEEPFDPSYRDVVTQKFDRQRLAGQSVIDVTLK